VKRRDFIKTSLFAAAAAGMAPALQAWVPSHNWEREEIKRVREKIGKGRERKRKKKRK